VVEKIIFNIKDSYRYRKEFSTRKPSLVFVCKFEIQFHSLGMTYQILNKNVNLRIKISTDLTIIAVIITAFMKSQLILMHSLLTLTNVEELKIYLLRSLRRVFTFQSLYSIIVNHG
jgi:hypothetical protein